MIWEKSNDYLLHDIRKPIPSSIWDKKPVQMTPSSYMTTTKEGEFLTLKRKVMKL